MPTDKEIDAAARILARGTCYSYPAFRGEAKSALLAAERVREQPHDNYCSDACRHPGIGCQCEP